MDRGPWKSIAVGIAWGAAGWAAETGFFGAFRVSLPFLFLPFVVAAVLFGDAAGYVAALITAPGAYYFTQPVGWRPRIAAVVSTVLYAVAATAVVFAVSQMRKRAAARERLIRSVSHDLKSPLSAITLQEEALLRKLERGERETAEALASHAGRTSRQVERVMSLIDNLLIAARLRARGVHLRRETCDLAAVARSVLDRLRPQLDEAHVELVFTCTAASCWGCWDPLALERMLTNLLTNAIKYGEGKPIALSIESRERFAAFVVADHGPGIPTAEQKHLFDPFEKGAAGQAAPLSYGLGLSIVRDLARAHGGEVGLDSRPGKGTAVRVTLPRERRRWAAASPLLAQRS